MTRWAAGLLALLPLLVLTPPADAGGPVVPARDPFYTYGGPRPLGSVPPGTVLRRRQVDVALGAGHSTPVTAEQLLYRTTDQQGRPAVTVTTVLSPTRPSALPRLIGYLSFYDGLGSECDPSYTLAGGDPGSSTYAQEADEEELLIGWYVSQGDIVTVPDFEGTDLAWMAGRQSGYATLDALRATESYLATPAGAEVGLAGYSGGSVAADWASELAPAYARSLDIVGVAEAGIPANYFDHLRYMSGSAEYSAAIPGELLGLSRAYGIDLSGYLSPYGRQVVAEEASACIASEFGQYPGLTIAAIMKPAYRDLTKAGPLTAMLRDQTMGAASTHPREPLLMGVGNDDGTGDGAMVAADVEDLARHYCSEGVPVDFQQYQGASHEAAGAFFDPQTGPFLQARFAGAPFLSNCASLSP